MVEERSIDSVILHTMDARAVQWKIMKSKEALIRCWSQFSTFSLQGFCHYLWLKIRGKSMMVTGSCHGCGRCCKEICLEGSEGWLRSEERFQWIVDMFPEYGRFTITGKDSQGYLLFSCTWSTEQGTCSDYENRLPLCRNYPESSLIFAGGRLLSGCGYGFAEVVPFKKVFRQELKKIR